MKEVKFSIILPCYNRANFLPVAIKSVISQSYENFELLIIDDGSSDKTEEVVKDFISPKIKYFKKKNQERNYARNFGIKKANGDYICFLDSDDSYQDNHLNECYKIIRNHNEIKWLYIGEIDRKFERNPDLLRKELINENIFSINGVVIKKTILNNLMFISSENAVVSEDHYLWLRLASRYPITVKNKITSSFQKHVNRSLNNIELSKLITGTNEIIESLKKDREFNQFYSNKVNFYFAFKYAFVALIANEKRNYGISYSMIGKAFANHPLIIFNKRYLAAVKNLLLGVLKIKN